MELEFRKNYKIDYGNKYNSKSENPNFYKNDTFKKVLLDNSLGYCMYCGRRIIIDNDIIYQIEHSVDKEGNYNQISQNITEKSSEKSGDSHTKDEETTETKKSGSTINEILLRCKFNLSIACPKCNDTYKKNVHKIDYNVIKQGKGECLDCKEMCSGYKECYYRYSDINGIMLMPHGYERNGLKAQINYDILKNRFIPKIISDNKNSNSDLDKDKEWIKYLLDRHIERFKLNAERYTNSIVNLCEEIIDLIDMTEHTSMTNNEKIFNHIDIVYNIKDKDKDYTYNKYFNEIEKLFIDYLKKYFMDSRPEELREFCALILMLDIFD